MSFRSALETNERAPPLKDRGKLDSRIRENDHGRRMHDEQIIIRRHERSPSPPLSPAPLFPPHECIKAPPVIQEIITHHRHIEHGKIEAQDLPRQYIEQGDPTDKLWTEITEDLVSEEAILERGYEYSKNGGSYYVYEHLKYVRPNSLSRVYMWSIGLDAKD